MTDHNFRPREGMFLMDAEQASAFNEPTRTDIMMLLAERPATTKQLAEAMDKPKGTVGHHLKTLEEAGLVEVVRTRKVRAITEKYYGRIARTYVFPKLEDVTVEDHGFLVEVMGEIRQPRPDEVAWFTLRHARIPAEQVSVFSERLLDLAEEFAAMARGGSTTYGFLAGVYPTDRPSLKEGDE